METGRRKDEATGTLVPAHFITELRVELNGQPVMQGLLSTAVSRNPYFLFRLNQAKPCDCIRVRWVDNLGQKDRGEVFIGGNEE